MVLENNANQDRFYFYLYLALIIWLPLPFGGNRPMFWVVMEGGTLLLVVFYILTFLRCKLLITHALRKAVVPVLLLVIVTAWIGMQGLTLADRSISMDVHASQNQFIKSLCYLAIFCLGLQLVTSRRRLGLLAGVIIYSGTLQALIAIMVNGKGLFINRNHLAGYLEMSLAVGVGAIIAHLNQGNASTWRENIRRLISTILGPKARVRICLVLMVIGLIVSRSRMGNTAFFSSMLIAGVIGLILFRKSSRGVVLLFASMIVIDFLLMGTFFGIDKLQQRFEETEIVSVRAATGDRLVGDQRFVAHDVAELIVVDNWLAGTGAGTFYASMANYRTNAVSQKNLHAEGDLFEFPSELGVIGTIPLALVVLLSFWISIKAQIQRRSPFFKAMGFPATMGIVAIMIHSWADFNLQITANAATFMVLLAMPYLALTIDRQTD